MSFLVVVWLSASALIAVAIPVDMHVLRVNRIWLPAGAWLLASAIFGAFVVVPYLVTRRRVRRELERAAFALLGDETYCMAIRRSRLTTLKQCGLLSDSLFRMCGSQLDRQDQSH
ncbi:hypothetical protein PCA31118_05090 [Pandoraea captiosa]|uniref:Uncharacterized protein n=1 Tax=Pandoraea captiosa TaxID=2508302 RepID=A0A5E5ASF1_9BURK|nr:hypothetical protein [Pandoraea captiosa]VVE75906.1 hypothetical protein PCA31118_05090 [Pandoraea captiosa]